jgi:hypothetical protein
VSRGGGHVKVRCSNWGSRLAVSVNPPARDSEDLTMTRLRFTLPTNHRLNAEPTPLFNAGFSGAIAPAVELIVSRGDP